MKLEHIPHIGMRIREPYRTSRSITKTSESITCRIGKSYMPILFVDRVVRPADLRGPRPRSQRSAARSRRYATATASATSQHTRTHNAVFGSCARTTTLHIHTVLSCCTESETLADPGLPSVTRSLGYARGRGRPAALTSILCPSVPLFVSERAQLLTAGAQRACPEQARSRW